MDSSRRSTTSSTTSITASSVFSELNRGPITDGYSAPATCRDIITSNVNERFLHVGHAGFGYFDPACNPLGTKAANELASSGTKWHTYYYSPAICPKGWTTAVTFSSGYPIDTQSVLSLGSGTTAALCCPSGFTKKDDVFAHHCQSTLSAKQVISYIAPTNFGTGWGNTDTIQSRTIDGSGEVVAADGVPIWWQASDSSVLAAAAAITQSSTPTPSPTGAQTSPTSSIVSPTGLPTQAESSGLSTGAKVGIGVAVPLAVIAALLMAFVFWRRRRRGSAKYGASHEMEAEYRPTPTAKYAHEMENPPTELYGNHQSYQAMHELPATQPGIAR